MEKILGMIFPINKSGITPNKWYMDSPRKR